MLTKQIESTPQGGLIVDKRSLIQAGLVGPTKLIIRAGEIRIVPESIDDPTPIDDSAAILDDLAGCLGEESAKEYDFQLKIGGYYEAR